MDSTDLDGDLALSQLLGRMSYFKAEIKPTQNLEANTTILVQDGNSSRASSKLDEGAAVHEDSSEGLKDKESEYSTHKFRRKIRTITVSN